MNSEYIQALIARIASGQNKIEDFPDIIQQKIKEKIEELSNKEENEHTSNISD